MRRVAVALLLAAVVAVGVHWGTFVAGGSDSYCYAYQAERWASGRLQVVEPLALEAPWPDAPLSFAPAGHLPSPTQRGAIVPICPAGLSIAMAPFLLIGGRDAIFLVVPLFGALLVGATFALGARFGARVGLASAAIVACSPVFLFQLMQPMSDVPAAALWVAAAAAATGTKPRGSLVAGVAAGVAILMRPNLVPLGVPIGLFLLFRPERTWAERVRAAVVYAAGCAAGCVAVAFIQNAYYGSPFSSGYGSLDPLFDTAHVEPNARTYFSWMTDTQTPAWLLAIAAPLLLPGALSTLLAAMAIVNVACYLPYVVFDAWWYLRFLLPAIALVVILMVAALDAAWRRGQSWKRSRVQRRSRSWGLTAMLILFTIAICAWSLDKARIGQAFQLHTLEAKYARAGAAVARLLPDNALVITRMESGSVRFYSDRRTLVWDGLDPAWLDRAVAYARERGLEPFLLFESWEEPLFRSRFNGSALARLDWPPMVEVAGQVRIYRPADRDRYHSGMEVITLYAR
jgi:dolichyl-phosphate-mannose-protein mannosyltransferase